MCAWVATSEIDFPFKLTDSPLRLYAVHRVVLCRLVLQLYELNALWIPLDPRRGRPCLEGLVDRETKTGETMRDPHALMRSAAAAAVRLVGMFHLPGDLLGR